MDERALIDKYFSWHTLAEGMGVGDDTAVISCGKNTLATVDTFHEGVHFPAHAPADKLAAKLWRSSFSDIVAMGGKGRYALLSLSLPEINHDWLTAFSSSLRHEIQQADCLLIGGDLVRGSIMASITCLGEASKPVFMSNACLDDDIWVTGYLGNACAFYRQLSDDIFFEESFYYPKIRYHFMQQAASYCSAATDISDGLLISLNNIALKSGTGMEINRDLPISEQLKMLSQAQECALYGGDDYQLCITSPKKHREVLQQIAEQSNTPITRIGTVIKDRGVKDYEVKGYDHFR